ncbi:MAG TPA: serine/threonine-protein kinase [Polyangiaceae bacterium]
MEPPHSGSLAARGYRLTRLIGEGGMGDVWEGVHAESGREVAIKRLRHSHSGAPDARARARFVLEAKAALAVEHPNVVRILEFVAAEAEPPAIVMELLAGETLWKRLEREPMLSVEHTARILLPVLSAVGSAHARGIVHRDLKPANVFLESRSSGPAPVKVLDFGIAKWHAERPAGTSQLTDTGSTLGTPYYMAPEQALGARSIDHRADIWSLGVVLYECLSGMRPIEGENAARIVERLLVTGIIPIERVRPDLPPELATLVGRMLKRELDQRTADLREVFGVLRAFTDAEPREF